MIWCSLYLLFRIQASWRHTRPETSSFQWTGFWGGLQTEEMLEAVTKKIMMNVLRSCMWPVCEGYFNHYGNISVRKGER